jgi:uncharacterized protein YndB with AHSA1/START domain
MNRQIRPAPVRKTIHVEAPPERAFDVFTKGIGRWWPKSHKIGRADLDRPVIEPFSGGRWYELGIDGAQCDVGRVLEWEPPKRVLLAWQLDQDWTYNPELITEVEVSFVPEGEGTRVNLEHRNLERLGEPGEAVRKQIDSPDGWGLLLKLYSDTAAK